MHAAARPLRAISIFGASVLIGRALSFVTLPVVAHHLSPGDYGNLELIASFVEIAGIVMNFGLAESLFRFTAATDALERRRIAAGLAGSALCCAAIVGLGLQLAVHALASRTNLGDLSTPLAFGLAGATFSGLIELPLAWLRLNGRAGRFLAFTAARSCLQAMGVVTAVSLGWGVVGILASNAGIEALIASALLARQWRDTGLSLNRSAARRALAYGLPIVGGALSMFALGSCDRWFLAQAVTPEQLGYYGLAAKFALLAPLAMQPFGLWWYARRIATLGAAGGLETCAHMTSLGFVMLGAGVALACGGAPLFIEFALPAAYRGALGYLPWMALIAGMNELCSLLNIGVYVGRTGLAVLAINAAGGATALVGYVALVGSQGVMGAIVATLAGQTMRLFFFVIVGRRAAPIAYDWRLLGLVAGIDVALVSIERVSPDSVSHVFALLAAFAALALAGLRAVGASAARERLLGVAS